MGWNTTIVLLNDGLDDIAKDPTFGERLKAAALESNNSVDRWVRAGNHANPAHVVESHHADGITVIAVGGNMGRVLGHGGPHNATPEQILANLAASMGYRIVKRNRK